MSKFTVIYYYVPEDHDDPSIPNAFGLPVEQSKVVYADIEKHFPLEGNYIFRFKYKHGKRVVWLDLQKKNEKVPTFEKTIFLKVTRMNWGTLENGEKYVEKQRTEIIQDHGIEGHDILGGSNGNGYQKGHSKPVAHEPNLFEGIDLGSMSANQPKKPAFKEEMNLLGL